MKNHKELFIEIGARIKSAREKAGFTQEKLGEAIGMSTQFVSDMERGVSGPSIHTLICICRTLHVSSDFLLMGISEESWSNSPFRGLSLMSPQEQQSLIRSVRRFNEAVSYNEISDN